MKRIYIEITSRCNIHCSFCHLSNRPDAAMDPAFFRRIVQDAKQYTYYIYLHVQGEPLTHPAFEEILNICDEEEMKVQLVTNGLLITQYPDLLQHPSLRKVSFSIQSVEYHNADPVQYMQNILHFCRKASAQGRPYCEIRFWRDDQLSGTRTAQCLEEIRKSCTMEDSGRKNNWRIMPGVYVDMHNTFEWPADANDGETENGTCHGAVDQIAVLCDGTVVPCCLDSEGTIRLGNMKEQTMADIFASPRYTAMAEGFKMHRLTEELCRRCTYRRRFG